MTDQAEAARAAVLRESILRGGVYGSAALTNVFVEDYECTFRIAQDMQLSALPVASSFRVRHTNVWVDKLYMLVAADQHNDAIDLIYDRIEALMFEDLEKVDALLGMINPNRLSAEEIVAVLIITLGAKDRLTNRQEFVDKSRPVIVRDGEDDVAVLHGLL